MNNIDNYTNQFFTFENPFFIAVILSIIVFCVIVLIFIKIIFPLQKKFILENQRYLLEKAEIMALFAEMDPDPLIRIDTSGTIIQTNEASRKVFPDIDKNGKQVDEFLPINSRRTNDENDHYLEKINDVTFSVIVKKYEKLGFSNIYLHDVTKIKKYELELENYKNKLKSFAERLDFENEELKKSLSFELHDDIGQQLLMIKMKLSQSEKYKPENFLSDIEAIYEKIRVIARTLKPIEINNLGLKLSIQSFIHSISLNSKTAGSLEFHGEEKSIDPNIAFCIYRIIQEAVNNVIKHSRATEFSIHIDIIDSDINIVISDNGIGIPTEYLKLVENKNLGVGLFSMRERIEKHKGIFQINSSPDEGTTLLIQLPKKGA